MDDYPRGPPHAGELHVDLISWMAFFSRTMKEIAEFIGEEEDASMYADLEKANVQNVDGLLSTLTPPIFLGLNER
jgi:mannosyl-oligosaccharide glucosidase